MRLTLRYLTVMVAVLGINMHQARGQNMIGTAVRLKPTTLPTTCNTGDLRVDQNDSYKLKICRSNVWSPITDTTAAFVSSKAVVTDGSGFLITSTASATEVSYLSGVTSLLQTQLDNKQSTATASITLNQIANITTATVLGRSAAGTGVIQQLLTLPAGVQANITAVGTLSENILIQDSAADTPTRKEMITLSRINGSNTGGTNFRAAAIAFKDSTTPATTYIGSIEGYRRDANNTWLGGMSFYLNQGGQATALTDMTEVMRINESAAVVIYNLTASQIVVTDSGKALTSIPSLTVALGGTGASSATAALTSLGAAARGANTDITSITGLTTALAVAQGGSGNGTLAVTAGGALYTDGTKIMNVGVGTSSQVLTSNAGSAPTWQNPQAGASIVTATSGIKTASGTGLWLQMTSASVAITTGRWMLFGSLQFDNNGSNTTWSQVGGIWAAANGVDNATAPAALTTATNLSALSVQKAAGAMVWVEPGTGTGANEYMNMQPVFVSCTSSCTAYLVPFAGFAGAAANTRITVYANAMKMSNIP